ncbi:MAG TPA: prepilin-type N-terminal cleavage/methylation domain-containing protein [Planctomycetota bacterium]|jgi:prepilin-type N-terminal cleavage/methylation domain-containing protein|nr:prepilin-type N-terminal cleavage/methylation domain-containing protein [Planctomycetota bacterium]
MSATRRRGFTLLELLVSLAIVALLAGTALPLLRKSEEEGDRMETADRMRRIDAAVLAFLEDCGRLPASLADLQTEPTPNEGWCGRYLADRFVSGIPDGRSEPDRDAWGRPFEYEPTSPTRARLRSAGSNGAPGDGDDLVKSIEGAPVFRTERRRRLEVLNTALVAFLRQYRKALDFPSNTDFEAVRSTLVDCGLLNADPRYRADPLGRPFSIDPAPSPTRPVCRFR